MKNKKLSFKIGTGLLIASIAIFIVPVTVSFMSIAGGLKAAIITGSIISAEVMFWTGAVLVGKEVAGKFVKYLNPLNWRSKKGSELDVEQ